MKYKIKDYAIALADIITSKKTYDKNTVNNFLELLERRGDFKNAKKIVELAEKYYLRKRNNKKIQLETARKTNVKNLLKNLYKAGDIIEEKINPALIAGVRVTIDNETEFDASLYGKLRRIF